jgi:NitT/TauT family transport system permease protein
MTDTTAKIKTLQIFRLIWQKSAVIVLLLIAWLIIPAYIDNMYIPPLWEVLKAYGDLIANGDLWIHIASSMRVVLCGFLSAEVIAISLGLLLGWFNRPERYLDPLLQVMRNTSVLALLPLFVLIFGIGLLSKTVIIAWGAFFPTLINTSQGVKNTDPNLIKSAKSMGIGNVGLFLKVVLPASSPYILAGIRLSAGIALIVIVGAEMIGASSGLGWMIFNYQQAYIIPKMYVGVLTLSIIGVIVNTLLIKLERKLTRWQERDVLV